MATAATTAHFTPPALPRAVLAASEASAKAWDNTYKAPVPVVKTKPVVAAPAELEQEDTDGLEAGPDDVLLDEIESELVTGSLDQPDGLLEDQDEQVTEEPDDQGDPGDQLAKLNQKFRTLSGKYNAETLKLREDNKNLAEQLRAQQANVQTLMDDHVANRTKAEKAAASAAWGKITGRPVEADLDPEFDADSAKYVSDSIHSATKPMLAKIRELEDALSKITGPSAPAAAPSKNQQFWLDLDREVPDWKTINVDPKWLAWLGKTDPVTGTSRQVLVDTALSALDVRPVAGLFKTYKKVAKARAHPPSGRSETEAEPTTGAKPNSAPRRAPARPAPPTELEIREFYRNQAVGKVSASEVEAFEARLATSMQLSTQPLKGV